MKNTQQNSARDVGIARTTPFSVCPPLRCGHRPGRAGREFCGEMATHVGNGGWWFEDAFRCLEHRLPTDVEVSADVVVRRVRVSLDVIVTGVSMQAPEAQREAVALVDAAVKAIGGVIDVQRVQSTVGRYPLSPAPGSARRAPGDPE